MALARYSMRWPTTHIFDSVVWFYIHAFSQIYCVWVRSSALFIRHSGISRLFSSRVSCFSDERLNAEALPEFWVSNKLTVVSEGVIIFEDIAQENELDYTVGDIPGLGVLSLERSDCLSWDYSQFHGLAWGCSDLESEGLIWWGVLLDGWLRGSGLVLSELVGLLESVESVVIIQFLH